VKGHQFLLQAWKLLRDRGVKASLWLAGDGELKASLKTLAAHLQLGDSIKFLGTLNHDDLLDSYKAGLVSAVVLASVDLGGGCHEGIPVALVEAMSHGVPVIATTTGGIPELVQPGTGLLVPPENPSALAGALENILKDEQLAQTIGQNGRDWVSKTRDVAFIASDLEASFSIHTSSTRNFESFKKHAVVIQD